jgi:GMP reductase
MKFDFEEINLIPKKCIVESRSECDTSVKLGKHTFRMPVIPANMECVIDADLAVKLSSEGYFYIMHRFYKEILSFIEGMIISGLPVSISIGVNDDSFKLIENIKALDFHIDYITIDIAHGHSIKMEKMLKWLRIQLPDTFIIAGNVCTRQAVNDLADWGADAVKVGIGPGSACTTWPTTGFGSRNCQASTILSCSDEGNDFETMIDIPIIAVGGIRVPADIAKSLVLGATMVMVGGMLSGFKDSPGNLINVNGVNKKEFWGSASIFQSNKKNRVEGTKILIDYKDRYVLDEMVFLQECLQSSISYGGGKDLNSLKSVNWK